MYPSPPPELPPSDPPEDQDSEPSEYEFTPPQKAEFARAAFWMEWVARFCIGGGGALAILGFSLGNLFRLAEGVGSVVIGICTWSVASSFRRVARTTGRDISYVLSAIDQLRWLYAIQLLLIPIIVVLAVVVLVLSSG
jgi:hypothetical protein